MVESALTRKEIQPAADGGIDGLPSTFTPGRNLLFLTLAASVAVTREFSNVVAGVCQTDYSGYPDCRRVFVDSFEDTFLLATGKSIKVHTPLMLLSKVDTWALASRLG